MPHRSQRLRTTLPWPTRMACHWSRCAARCSSPAALEPAARYVPWLPKARTSDAPMGCAVELRDLKPRGVAEGVQRAAGNRRRCGSRRSCAGSWRRASDGARQRRRRGAPTRITTPSRSARRMSARWPFENAAIAGPQARRQVEPDDRPWLERSVGRPEVRRRATGRPRDRCRRRSPARQARSAGKRRVACARGERPRRSARDPRPASPESTGPRGTYATARPRYGRIRTWAAARPSTDASRWGCQPKCDLSSPHAQD